MNVKTKYKKILAIFAILMVSCLLFNYVSARVTISKGNVGGEATADPNAENEAPGFGDILKNIFGTMIKMVTSGIFATLTTGINGLSMAMFMIIWLVFGPVSGKASIFPFPDNIVFNRIPLFDPNFIAPSSGSLIERFDDVLGNIFASFLTVAYAIFIIAAMVAGVKMALSSLATTKAQYKEAAMKWVSGFLILICLRWIITGIFYINEEIVADLYNGYESLTITVHVYETLPMFGQGITNVIKLLPDNVKPLVDSIGWKVNGYMGLAIDALFKSIGGGLISSIIAFVLLGQALVVIGSYLKRLFMIIMLGVVSPLIVAVDTVMSSMGQRSTIFMNWLKAFALTVMMQTLHAVYLLVAFNIISRIHSEASGFGQGMESVVTIALITGLVKMEKVLKSLFGIGDSFAGDLKAGAGSMIKAMGAVKGIAAGAKAVGDNAGKLKEANKRKRDYGNKLDNLKGTLANNKAEEAKSKNDKDAEDKYRKQAKEYGIIYDPETGKPTNLAKKKKDKDGDEMSLEDRIREAEAGFAKAHAEMRSATFATIMGPANLAAGIGLGIGMGDDISEALFKGGHITAALDKGAEAIGYKIGARQAKRFSDSERKAGGSSNQPVVVDSIAIAKEVGKQLSGVGNQMSDTMRQELRKMDRHIDNNN